MPVFDFLYADEKPGMVYNVKANLEKFPVDITLVTDFPSRKVRLVDAKTKHHLVRIDKDRHSKEPFKIQALADDVYDAIVISDYEKGFISSEIIGQIINLYTGPIYVDTKKKDLQIFKNCFVKINESERNICTSLCDQLIVTMGPRGALYNNELFEAEDVRVADVCGAGDTFLAALAYYHLKTGDIRTAIRFANKASAVTVQHFGTYAPSPEEFI